MMSMRGESDNKVCLAVGSETEELINNIPGGVYQCLNDPYLTLTGVYNSFLSMFGYTKQDVSRLFNNRLINMVCPADREEVLGNVRRQLSVSNTVELEYRVMCKNGEALWVLDKGRLVKEDTGLECFCCVLIDISERKKEQEELRLSLERHQVIMNQTTDIIFEWDILKDTLTFSANWPKKFGYTAISTNISKRIPLSSNIHPEDMPAFVKIMQAMSSGTPYSETEFRIRDRFGQYTWCRIRATAQYDEEDTTIKAVGVIIDIDAEKKQTQALLDRAQKDTLTGLYNKEAVRELIEEKRRGSSAEDNHALMIIDVDYFKQVNDTYGHLCGDSLLSEVAATLKGQFRTSDIIGRIGGDEFLVYLSNPAGKKEVESKIRNVLATLQELRPSREAGQITCSIGIAFYRGRSVNYQVLYKWADIALYHVKGTGRNNFAFYDSEESDRNLSYMQVRSAVSEIDYQPKKGNDVVGEQLVEYTFRMLYESIDVETAVKRLLEIVGRSYDVSRVYIFESSEDKLSCSNTFEWCGTGTCSEIDKLQNLLYKEDLGDYLDNFDENGIFYCRDIKKLNPVLYRFLEPQGIYSILQCAIMDGGHFEGYVGFDECRENRYWTQGQVQSLTLIANVLSIFLIKLRLKERLLQMGNKQSLVTT